MQNKINSIPQLLEFFRNTKRHLFYVGSLFGLALININDFMPTFEILACSDPFFGALPFIKIPSHIKDHRCTSPVQCQSLVLENSQTVAYMKSKDASPSVIFSQITPELVQFCQEKGINWWGTTPKLFSDLGNKVQILNLLKKVDIPFIPNICSKINSYQHFREITSPLGTISIVTQSQLGRAGQGTLFIKNENNYNTHQVELESGDEHKIMAFRSLKCFAINGVVTSAGTVLGPLMSELIGHPQLTPFRGGYCGNQIRSQYFEDKEVEMKVRKEIFFYAQKFANFLHKQVGFKGLFGFDFVVDQDTNQVFFMEINPRLTGSSTLSYQVYGAQGYKFPIFLFHCLEFLGVEINLDISALNKEWIGLEHYQNEVCHIVFKQVKPTDPPYSINAELWQLENNIPKSIGRTEYRISEMKDDDILFLPNKCISNGSIIMRKRCQDYRFKLTKNTEAMIDTFLKLRFKDSVRN